MEASILSSAFNSSACAAVTSINLTCCILDRICSFACWLPKIKNEIADASVTANKIETAEKNGKLFCKQIIFGKSKKDSVIVISVQFHTYAHLRYQEIRDETRSKILKDSMLYFAKNGFAGTKISDLAKHIGIGQIFARELAKEALDEIWVVGRNEKRLLALRKEFGENCRNRLP